MLKSPLTSVLKLIAVMPIFTFFYQFLESVVKEAIVLPELPKFGLPNLGIDFKGTFDEIRAFSFKERKRGWKKIFTAFFLGLVLFSAASFDVGSDSSVADSFIGGTNYTYPVHNLTDLSHHVNRSNCIITRDLPYHVKEANNLLIYEDENEEIVYGNSLLTQFAQKTYHKRLI